MHNMLKSILGFGALAAVSAAPITFTDIVNPDHDVRIVDGGAIYSFTHNINNEGFVSSTDDIDSAEIDIRLRDDEHDIWFLGGATETVRVRLDNVTQGNAFEVNSGIYSFNVKTQFLQTDGSLVVTLEARSGDFYFQEFAPGRLRQPPQRPCRRGTGTDLRRHDGRWPARPRHDVPPEEDRLNQAFRLSIASAGRQWPDGCAQTRGIQLDSPFPFQGSRVP